MTINPTRSRTKFVLWLDNLTILEVNPLLLCQFGLIVCGQANLGCFNLFRDVPTDFLFIS